MVIVVSGSARRRIDASKLPGVWFHSHEEDEGERVVFRGLAYEFPPSRMPRAVMRLMPDGVAMSGQPGPDDRPREQRGSWSLDGRVLTIDMPGVHEEYVIESVEDDVLIARRRTDR